MAILFELLATCQMSSSKSSDSNSSSDDVSKAAERRFPGRFRFKNGILEQTRRLKSFPWDALVYGSIMAFYLGKWNKTKQNLRLLYPGSNSGLQSSIKFQCFNSR